jgi:uncharacterized protein
MSELAVPDGPTETIETHLSWVVLTRERVYKRKKPLRLPFLDHGTLEARRRSCEQEVALGRRLAPSVYLEVVPVVATAAGLVVGGPGEVVDWAVVMRRLPADRMLPEVLARGAATLSDADAVAEVLAAFYRRAVRAAWTGEEHRRRLTAWITADLDELERRGVARDRIGPLHTALLATIAREADRLDARIAQGRVIEAHGDLRPEHVCLESPPVIIDPLEFDANLRTLDAASELAFFALECDRLGAGWFGSRVLARYAEHADDGVPAELLALYRAQHAITRALIALRHVDDQPPAEHARWRAKADAYLDHASRTTVSGRP